MRPTTRDNLAAKTLLFTSVAGYVLNYFTSTGAFDTNLKPGLRWLIAIVSLTFSVVFFYYIRRGRKWVKYSFLLLLTSNVLFGVLDFNGIRLRQLNTVPRSVNYALQWILNLATAGAVLYSLRKPREDWNAQMRTDTSNHV